MSVSTRRITSVLSAALCAVALPGSLLGYTKTGSTYLTDGSQADVAAALGVAADGETVRIPPGTFTWGDNRSQVFVTRAVTLAGSGPSLTTIRLSGTGPTGQAALINISGGGTVRDFRVECQATVANGLAAVPLFAANTVRGWRISNITYVPADAGENGAPAYFCIVASGSNYGLIDSCNIGGARGTNELIFGRGPTDSWQTADSLGGADNVFIEDCAFTGPGYICDANSNARFVVRYCTIAGAMKVDAHGVASNSPPRSARHMEVYGNVWSGTDLSWNAIEIRGGTGMVFDNINTSTNEIVGRLRLTDYAYTSGWSNFGGIIQTLADYPLIDQIGIGMDPKVAASQPMYLWNNRRGTASDYSNWTVTVAPIPDAAIERYRTQVNNPTATYTMADMIKADREYYTETYGTTFNGTTGVGRGTKSQMLAIAPTKTGVGFWVTDEGEWNSRNNGADGQLYVWNGTAWVVKYRPYTYPHPLRAPRSPTNLRIQ